MELFQIRAAGPDDIKELLEIERLSFPTCWLGDFLRREFDPSLVRMWCAFAVNDPCPMVGYLSAIRVVDELHLLQLAAHPRYRRMRVGSTLLEYALGKERSLRYALLEVRETNTAAIAFYQKMGFYIVGRRRRYYSDSGEDAMLLTREIA